MKEKFPTLFAALAVEEMQMSEEGAFLNMGLLETLNAAIEAAQKEAADAKALADQLTTEKNELTAQVETLNADHQKAIDDLNAKIADQEQDITAKEETIGNLQNDLNAKQTELNEKETELNGVKESLTTAENTLADRDQQISDLNAQLTELQNNAGAEPQAGAAPQNNGGGAESPELVVNRYVFDKNLSYEENCRAEEEWNKAHGK